MQPNHKHVPNNYFLEIDEIVFEVFISFNVEMKRELNRIGYDKVNDDLRAKLRLASSNISNPKQYFSKANNAVTQHIYQHMHEAYVAYGLWMEYIHISVSNQRIYS